MRFFSFGYLLVHGVTLTCMVMPLIAAESFPDLRVMPLGDSITKGSGSSHCTGYREGFRNKILNHGSTSNAVDMIGSLQNGKMLDNDHEGHSGKYLGNISDYLHLSIKAKPNVVLVHAGTNNMDYDVDLPIAHEIMEQIINQLFQGSPSSVVLVAPVIWANDDKMNENSDAFNKKLHNIIQRKQKEGKHVLSVPIDIGPNDLADKKHPNDNGYEKMANAWVKAIVKANDAGWIEPPIKVDLEDLPGTGLGHGSSPSTGCA